MGAPGRSDTSGAMRVTGLIMDVWDSVSQEMVFPEFIDTFPPCV